MCNLDDVIGMVQTSTQIQEQKAESLEAFSQKTEEFTAEAARIDEDANVKHFFTLLGKMFFTSYGKEFFIYHGKQIFTSQGKHLFTRYGKQTLSSAQPCG